jgi:translation initiation factor 4G
MSMQDPPALKQVNRFAMFGDDDGDSVAMPPPANTYHGRASEPAYRTGNYGGANRSRDNSKESFGGRNSREGSYIGRHSREGSYSGRNSREGSYSGRTSREGGRVLEREIITEGVTSILKGNKCEERSQLVEKTKPILAEYFHNVDLVEAFNCISELYHIDTIHLLVENILDIVVEKKEKDRVNAGKLVDYLLKNESLPRKEFVKGVNGVLEYVEDILIDIPNYWEYFANVVGSILLEKTVDLNFLKESCSFLLENGQAGKYVSAVLTHLSKIDMNTTVELWQKSGLNFEDFNVENSEQFIKDNKLDFLDHDVVNGASSDGSEGDNVSDSLDALLSKNDINIIFGYIDDKFPAPRDSKVLRTIVSRVIFHCIDGSETSCIVNEGKLREFGVLILKKYLDAVKSSELEALYSLQSLVNSLEHPNKLLHSIFDTLYDCDVISEDAFLEWEESSEPGEQEGKGVALKSCTQFFQWLKTAEPEDEEEEQKASFTIGDENSVTAAIEPVEDIGDKVVDDV